MPSPLPENPLHPPQAPRRLGRNRFAFSLGALFLVITAICLYQGYRTNRQVEKYYTPAPIAAYSPADTPYEFTDSDFAYPLDPRPATVQLQERIRVISDR